MSDRPRPVVLCLLDGVGERAESEGNALRLARTPALDALAEACPPVTLIASGPEVGLHAGSTGSSRAGHLVLGAGRPLPSERVRVDQAIAAAELGKNEAIDQTMRICLYDGCKLHLLGLLSDGGVHSSMDHLLALVDLADFHEIGVVVHAILDGRDSPRRSALDYLDRLEGHLAGKDAVIGTVSGRGYAMDRDGRWDRVYRAYHAIVRDKILGPAAERADSPYDAVSQAYGMGLGDDLVEPVRIGAYQGMAGDFVCDFGGEAPIWEWTGEDCGLAFNFRGDRLQQLSRLLTRQGVPAEAADLLMDRDKPVRAFREHCYTTMTSYSDALSVPVAFPAQPIPRTLGELIAGAGLGQLRCAETEKEPHVTRFFGGDRDEPFAGERRIVVRSPRLVESYDQKPEMAAAKLTDQVVAAIRGGEADFILVTFANPDAVAHSGRLDAAVRAVEAVDQAVGRVVEAVRASGGALLVTAGHGNCEAMVDGQGRPHGGHTDSPVPLYYLDTRDPAARLRQGGSLADVAPTIVELLGLEQPAEMVGRSLRVPAVEHDQSSPRVPAAAGADGSPRPLPR